MPAGSSRSSRAPHPIGGWADRGWADAGAGGTRIDRTIGRSGRLADGLRRARQSRQRLLAAAGAGVSAAVGGVFWGYPRRHSLAWRRCWRPSRSPRSSDGSGSRRRAGAIRPELRDPDRAFVPVSSPIAWLPRSLRDRRGGPRRFVDRSPSWVAACWRSYGVPGPSRARSCEGRQPPGDPHRFRDRGAPGARTRYAKPDPLALARGRGADPGRHDDHDPGQPRGHHDLPSRPDLRGRHAHGRTDGRRTAR